MHLVLSVGLGLVDRRVRVQQEVGVAAVDEGSHQCAGANMAGRRGALQAGERQW